MYVRAKYLYEAYCTLKKKEKIDKCNMIEYHLNLIMIFSFKSDFIESSSM